MKLEAMVIVPDTHRPYHDKRAWALFLQVAKDMRPKHLIQIGDFADFYKVSSHSKDPARVLTFNEELDDVNVGLDELDALGATSKIFCAGNHENRLERYLQDKAPELYGVVSIPELFGLKERGWEYVAYKNYTRLGKLYISHDVGTAGRYAAHRALDAFQHSNITGHTHRLCYVVEGNAVAEFKLSASFGWLGDRNAVDYMQRVNVNKNWALGFGVGYMNPQTGVAYLTPVPLVDYTCVVNGKFYEG